MDTSVEEFSTTITPRPAYSTSPDPKVLVPLDASGTSPRHPAAFTPSSLGLLIRTTLVRIPGEMQR